jgi:hypothetical protein
MICPECHQEKGCGCSFQPHPYKNLSVCSHCYALAIEDLKVKKATEDAKKPQEGTNEPIV